METLLSYNLAFSEGTLLAIMSSVMNHWVIFLKQVQVGRCRENSEFRFILIYSYCLCDIVLINYMHLLLLQNSAHEVERKEYHSRMLELCWFFFDLLIMGYVEDKSTGLCFHYPEDLEWTIYVEVS